MAGLRHLLGPNLLNFQSPLNFQSGTPIQIPASLLLRGQNIFDVLSAIPLAPSRSDAAAVDSPPTAPAASRAASAAWHLRADLAPRDSRPATTPLPFPAQSENSWLHVAVSHRRAIAATASAAHADACCGHSTARRAGPHRLP